MSKLLKKDVDESSAMSQFQIHEIPASTAVEAGLFNQESLIQNKKDFLGRCTQRITSEISIILPVHGTSQSISSMGIMARICRRKRV